MLQFTTKNISKQVLKLYALTIPKSTVLDSMRVTYGVSLTSPLIVLNGFLGKETFVKPKSEPWGAKNSGRAGPTEDK